MRVMPGKGGKKVLMYDDAPNRLILHHDDEDGFTAAWIVWRICRELNIVDGTTFHAVQYGNKPPDVTGKHVYILDFSWPRADLEKMQKQAKSLVVLDHHKTAEEELRGMEGCIFDVTKSGARLTWEYFSLEGPKPAPTLVEYVEDRDLWKFELEASREINAAIKSYNRTFANWEMLHLRLTQARAGLVSEGKAILRYQAKEIQTVTYDCDRISLDGKKTFVPCANVTGSIISEAGQFLAMSEPYSVVFYRTRTHTVFCLRSGLNGADVGEIARKFGGGGHKHAAGFQLSNDGKVPGEIKFACA